MIKDTTISAGSLGFDSQAGQIGHSRQRLAAAATFLPNCVAQTVSLAKMGPPLLTHFNAGPAPGGPGPPINKFTFLKTAAFEHNLKLWPPLINAGPSKSTALLQRNGFGYLAINNQSY